MRGPMFSLTIPFEKARNFKKRSGQYLRESQYHELTIDLYLKKAFYIIKNVHFLKNML